MENSTSPGLFGLKHSSRDFSQKANWGKNIFNSSFPASLVAYMHSKDTKPVYLCIDKDNTLVHKYISGEELFRIDPLSDDAHYNFEAGFSQFEKYYTGKREKIDLVLIDRKNDKNLIGLEIKLTALPDDTTKDETEDKFSCEIVVRPPTICFLACSLCELFKTVAEKDYLRTVLNTVPKIIHWEEVDNVIPHYEKIEEAVKTIAKHAYKKQRPLMIQPIWKMKDNKLAEDCLDVFAWSNLAILHLCYTNGNNSKSEITRFQRAIIWVYLMLKDYVDYGIFDYIRIVKDHSYEKANDKAFAMSGTATWKFLQCKELTHPRIGKNEIRNIILGGGQNLLSPERRFDAVIVNSPDLFD